MYRSLLKALAYLTINSEILSGLFRTVKFPGLWDEISRGTVGLTEDYVYEYRDCINWTLLCEVRCLRREFIIKVLGYVDFKAISRYHVKLTCDDFIKFYHLLDWDLVSQYKELDENTRRICKDKINWYIYSTYHKLGECDIDEHADKVNWVAISQQEERFTTDFLYRFGHKFHWGLLSKSQKLPIETIRQRKSQVDMAAIAKLNYITREEFQDIFGVSRDSVLLLEAYTLATSIGKEIEV
jgi:hypothetical protein